jgi:hypothetical protein
VRWSWRFHSAIWVASIASAAEPISSGISPAAMASTLPL